MHDFVPEWSLGDRLRKARSLTGMTAAQFAAKIGVSDSTINNAEGDKRAVRRITLNAWALATGVSLEWLETGIAGTTTPPPDGDRLPDTPAMRRLTEAKRRGQRDTRASTHEYARVSAAAA